MWRLTKSVADSSGFPRHRSRMPFGFWPIAVSGMIALLGIVAFLQYRWTNEASQAEQVRINSDLQSLMLEWHNDLYGEFSAICIAMQVGPDSGARDTWNDYLDRYVEWNNALPHEFQPYIYRNPALVGDIYIWETGAQKPHLFLLNLDRKQIEQIETPNSLSDLLLRLQSSSSSLPAALAAWRISSESPQQVQADQIESSAIPAGTNPISGWQFDPRVPAIVHPIFHRSGKTVSSDDPVDWIVITLDMKVLQQKVLPELASRNFGGADRPDYKIAVVSAGRQSRTIFSSYADFGLQNLNDADARLDIFALPGADQGLDAFTDKRNGKVEKSKGRLRTVRPAWFPVIEYSSHPEDWILLLQQRGEPLQSVLNRVRLRNLAVSAVVLLLLAITIGLLTVAGFRGYRFAELQMDFVASISHNLRTPLTSIFSAGENISDGVVTDESALRNYGALIMDNSRQLRFHVDRILRFASIRSGKDRYNLGPLEVPRIFAQVRKDTSALMAGKACVLEEYIEPSLPAIIGDRFAVCECLENLISNAVKYCRNDRRIRIYAISDQSAGGVQEVAIRVEDHGIGINPSELDKIFEPFYRSPHAVAAHVRGTGLGLFLARHVANAMGGRLTVKSTFGSGSVFTLHLRCANTNLREIEQLPKASSSVKG